jgi:hypothetical protein
VTEPRTDASSPSGRTSQRISFCRTTLARRFIGINKMVLDPVAVPPAGGLGLLNNLLHVLPALTLDQLAAEKVLEMEVAGGQ